jgi:flagellar biosynthesis protein FlhB
MMQQSASFSVIGLESSSPFDIPLLATVVLPTLAVMAAAGAVGLVVRMMLDGPAWRPARVMPAFDRISLLGGLARIFSTATLMSLAGHACGLAVLVTAAALSARPLVAVIGSGEMAHDPARLFAAAQQAILPLLAAAAVVAACTWALSRMRFERRIRMTPQEYADEARSMQADPKVRLMRQQHKATRFGPRHADVVVSRSIDPSAVGDHVHHSSST